MGQAVSASSSCARTVSKPYLFWWLGLAFERKADAPSYWKLIRVKGSDRGIRVVSRPCKAGPLPSEQHAHSGNVIDFRAFARVRKLRNVAFFPPLCQNCVKIPSVLALGVSFPRKHHKHHYHRWPSKERCHCAPLYEPAWWNDSGQKQFNNNCYNYATNYRTDTFAQPGRANAAMYTSLSCASVRPAAVVDDLIAAPGANNKCPREGHLVALVIWPGVDFHWYRKGRNGYWSHKPGGTPVRNVDNSNQLDRFPFSS
jgi:hypothetical protein